MEQYLWLIVFGLVIGAYGTFVGAGGGFVLVPLLILLYPEEPSEIIASISLAVVFFNALSGSVAYARMKRIDYKSGFLFSAATIPGAIMGAFTTGYVPRQIFDTILGSLMIITSIYLIIKPIRKQVLNANKTHQIFSLNLTELNKDFSILSYKSVLGIVSSLIIGYISTLLGIGGGIIHVPILVNLLGFPVHIASATSHFILAIMSLTGTIVHIRNRNV